MASTFMLLGSASSALAQTCTTDKDCPSISTCVTAQTGGAPPACKGTDCSTASGAADPAPSTYSYCETKSCSVDADCGAGAVCYEQMSTACSGSAGVVACPANTACDGGVTIMKQESCTTTTRKICAFKWQLPCNADADCGDGFTCEPTELGSCSGSGGTGSAGPGMVTNAGNASSSPATSTDPTTNPTVGTTVPPPAPVPGQGVDGGAGITCTTTKVYPGVCVPTATSCTMDSDCPTGWTCGSIAPTGPATPLSTGAPTRGASEPASGQVAVDAGAATPPDSSSARQCLAFGFPYPARGVDSSGTVTTGGKGNEGAPTGSAATPPTASTGASNPTAAGHSGLSSGGGCAVAPGGSPLTGSAFAGLATLALVLLRGARRRRR